MSSKPNIPPNVEGLATLLVLQDQIKKLVNLKEFGYFTTNETHRLFHYNTAYLWQKNELNDVALLAQSELGELDSQSPINQWLIKFINQIVNTSTLKEIQIFNFNETPPNAEPGAISLKREMLDDWPQILPKYVLWAPFVDPSSDIPAGLIFFREQPFSEQEAKMFRWLLNNYQYAWFVLTKGKLSFFRDFFKKKKTLKFILLIIVVILLFPVRLSVVASAIVSAKDPALINAPIAGTIKEFLVKPGELVKADQLLLTLDKKDLINSVEINQKKVQLAEAKLRSASNQGFSNQVNRSDIPILQAELAVDNAELEFSKSVLAKADILSPIPGVAVFDSKEDWIGQPVQIGETILTIADPNKVELKIYLPVSDLIGLEQGGEAKFYLYGQLAEIPVVLTSLSYNAKMTPSKILAYQYLGAFSNPLKVPRLGGQGSVRLYGKHVPVIYYILRRPLQALRQTFGI